MEIWKFSSEKKFLDSGIQDNIWKFSGLLYTWLCLNFYSIRLRTKTAASRSHHWIWTKSSTRWEVTGVKSSDASGLFPIFLMRLLMKGGVKFAPLIWRGRFGHLNNKMEGSSKQRGFDHLNNKMEGPFCHLHNKMEGSFLVFALVFKTIKWGFGRLSGGSILSST